MADTTRYSELCRLCAEKTNELLAVNIFDNDGNARQLNKKIGECLPVHIHEADQLPKMICDQCIYKLDLFSDFRERSLRTETMLVDLYKQLNTVSTEQLKIEELMMVHQHHLLNENMHEVGELELNQLEHRDTLIVEHQIIDINSHALPAIEINHHELNQTVNSHNLQVQEPMIVNNAIQNPRYTEELIHQQHQLAYAAQTYTLGDIALSNAVVQEKDTHFNPDLHSVLTVQSTLTKSEHNSDNVLNQKQYEMGVDSPSINDSTQYIKHEDSNSECRLLIDEGQPHVFIDVNCETYMEDVATEEDKIVETTEVCNICKKTISKVNFHAHYEQHFIKCIVCSAVLSNKEALESHSKEVHGDTTETIKKNIKDRLKRDSRKSNESESDLEEEESDEKADEADSKNKQKQKRGYPKVCDSCGKSYKSNYKLAEHMRKHTGEKPFKCGSCDKAFRSKIGLAQHEAKHTGQYDYACSTCGKGFQCKSYLMVHQRVHSDVKPYPCTTCGQNFKTKQSLMDHTNRHLGVKPYICDICGRGFITKGLLRAHQKTHTGEDNRKYSCTVCNKMFVSKSYLQTHMKIHTGEKPYPCSVCGKGFLTRVDLRIHSTMHTGEKSYMCEICGKAFARRDALRCHRRSHTGERPYACDICGQTFTQFSPMMIHKRLHTGERPYSCEVCNRKFITRSSMSTHLKRHNVNVKQENG